VLAAMDALTLGASRVRVSSPSDLMAPRQVAGMTPGHAVFEDLGACRAQLREGSGTVRALGNRRLQEACSR
jgi:hypothetical protein